MVGRQPLQLLEIELLEDGGGTDSHDVDFGGRQRRSSIAPDSGDVPGSRRRLVGGMLGGIALAAVAIIATRGDTSPGVSAGEAISVPPLAIAESQPADTRGPGDFPPPTVVVFGSISGGAPILATDQPWMIYFESYGDVYRLDVQSGDLKLFEDGEGEDEVFSVAQTVDGPRVVRQSPLGYATFLGPPGTYWRQSDVTGRYELIDAISEEVIRTPKLSWGEEYFYVAATTGGGDLLVYGPDRRMWVLGSDDVLSPLRRGSLVAADQGGKVWYRCDDTGLCQAEAETSVGTQVISSDARSVYSFSPDGTWLMLGETDQDGNPVAWTILDMRLGTTVPVDLPLGASTLAFNGSSTSVMTWSPDGRFATLANGLNNTLVTLDTQTMAVTEVEVTQVDGPLRVLAVL